MVLLYYTGANTSRKGRTVKKSSRMRYLIDLISVVILFP